MLIILFVFCFGRYGRAKYLSWVVHQTVVRAFNRYLFPMKDIFHVSSNIYKLRLLLCCLRVLFHQLASPPGFNVAHIPKGNLVHIYKCVFLARRHFFLFRPRVFPRSLGSVACREPARTPHASLGPGRGPWHVLWEFKVARSLGEGFRASRDIQAPANPRTRYRTK